LLCNITLLCRSAVRLLSNRDGVWSGRVRADGGCERGTRDHLLRDGIPGLRDPGGRRIHPTTRGRCPSNQPANTRRPVRATAHPSRTDVAWLRSTVPSRLQLRWTGRWV